MSGFIEKKVGFIEYKAEEEEVSMEMNFSQSFEHFRSQIIEFETFPSLFHTK